MITSIVHSLRSLALFGALVIAGLQAQTSIYINFGSNATNQTVVWNNNAGGEVTPGVFEYQAGFTQSLVDGTGAATGVGYEIIGNFHSKYADGKNAPIGDFAAPVVRSGFAGTQSNGKIQFTGLDTNTAYTFEFVASKAYITNGNTRYTLTNGLDTDYTEVSAFFDGAVNSTVTSFVSSFMPSADGTITLTVGSANPSSWAYINGIIITTAAVPEPSTFASLAGVAALGLAAFGRRSRVRR